MVESEDHPSDRPSALQMMEGALVALSAVCILGICALITMTVATRWFFAWSVPDYVTIVQELMIASVTLPLAHVAADRSHITVEVFTNMMPVRVQPALNLLSSFIGFLVLIPIVYGGYADLTGVIEDEAYFFGDLELPEFPGRTAFFVGYVAFALRLAVLLVADAISVSRPAAAGKAEV